MDFTSIILIFIALISSSIAIQPKEETGEVLPQCESPLGMEHKQIPSSRISASSSFDVKSTGPQNARIRTELVGGAWCPLLTIVDGVKEYLEIDLDTNYRLTRTETQGRFGNGMGQEFAKQFQLEYWRESVGKWTKYKDHTGNHILEGNTNTYTAVQQILNPSIIASKIRFIPHSLHPMTVCMRVELYGCPYSDGLLYYDCPQGYWKNNPEVDLRDLAYDGWVDDDEILRSGLGLLTDSILGEGDFKAEKKFQGHRWIGWDSTLDPVKIAFQFDGIRKFTSVLVHINNLVAEGVQIFGSADIYLSVDGQKFSEFPLRWTPPRDLDTEAAHTLIFSLKGRLASLIRLEFFHSNYWLLISEITFDSEPYTGIVTEQILSLTHLQDEPETLRHNTTITIESPNHAGSDIGALGMVIGSIGLCLLACLLLASFIFLRATKAKAVGDLGIGLRPKGLNRTVQKNSTHFHQHKGQKENLCWTADADEGESFYNELAYRGYEPTSFSNPSSSNSTASSNITRSAATTTKTNRKATGQMPFADYLNLEGGLRYYSHTSVSQPSTPKSDRGGTACPCPDLAPPLPKVNRPIPTARTLNPKAPLFTTPTSASLHVLTSPYQPTASATRPRNYYASTDILRKEAAMKQQLSQFGRY